MHVLIRYRWLVILGLVLLFCSGIAQAVMQAHERLATSESPEDVSTNHYLGAGKCKVCHASDANGNAHKKWFDSQHRLAYSHLASAAAKELALKHGVADAQQSPKCLKCHVTAFGEPAERLSKSFKIVDGVQCESCHGPGENHFKKRLSAPTKEKESPGAGGSSESGGASPLSDEIILRPPVAQCLACHNSESPTFAGFCFKKALGEILHHDPRKARSKVELAQLSCSCGEKCTCQGMECGGWPETPASKGSSGTGN